MATVIDGKAYAADLRSRVAEAVSVLITNHRVKPGLAVVLVGEDPASQVYVRNKGKQTTETGMESVEHKLPAETSEQDLLALIDKLNNDPGINGILVQLPLPKHIDESKVINTINVDKDVDGFHIQNVGKLSIGVDSLVPCTPAGCILLLKDQIGDLTGKNAVVVGRSNIVGKPVSMLLLKEHCTVTIAHSRTSDLPAVCRGADILVAAVGVPELVKGDWIKPGATVIDVGINRIEAEGGKTRLVGDVDYAEASKVAGAITPVPGGVGPMTIACLLRNTVIAACRQRGIDIPAAL
ncbi:MAG: bifunctional methylenetetrahydrofolate dehydrogenase/methenyltetrahydrofolate cyclohydrolase FolD [Arenicellales bacterium]